MVRSQALLMEPLPSANRILAMVIQYERQQTPNQPTIEEQNSFVNVVEKCHLFGKGKGVSYSEGKGNFTHNNGKGTPNKECMYCGHTRHTIDVCYSKQGYPHGHPRYLRRPRYHNHASSSTSVNNTTMNEGYKIEEGNKNEDHTPGSGLNNTTTQYQRLITSNGPIPNDNFQSSRANLSYFPHNGSFDFTGPSFGNTCFKCFHSFLN